MKIIQIDENINITIQFRLHIQLHLFPKGGGKKEEKRCFG